jgi:hypothetical protein
MAKKKTATAQTSVTASKPSEDQLLTAQNILDGGDNPLTLTTVPGLLKDGKPGAVYHRAISAGAVIDYMALKNESKEQFEEMIRIISESLVKPDGSAMFAKEELRQASVTTIKALGEAVFKFTSDEPGNASSGVPRSASSTD